MRRLGTGRAPCRPHLYKGSVITHWGEVRVGSERPWLSVVGVCSNTNQAASQTLPAPHQDRATPFRNGCAFPLVTCLFLTGVAFNPQTLSPCRGITGVGTGLISGAGGPLGHHLASPAHHPVCLLALQPLVTRGNGVHLRLKWDLHASSVSLRKKGK